MRAIDGARTRGLDLGKVARYQLRHYRMLSLSVSDLINIPYLEQNVNIFFEIFFKNFYHTKKSYFIRYIKEL